MKAATPKFTDSIIINQFQSTPPVKAATTRYILDSQRYFISIHAAREGGDGFLPAVAVPRHISIHAAREGGDSNPVPRGVYNDHFNPRRP